MAINKKMFEGEKFSASMAFCNGRSLWVTYCDGAHSFRVEDLNVKGVIVCETQSLGEAIREFNAPAAKETPCPE